MERENVPIPLSVVVYDLVSSSVYSFTLTSTDLDSFTPRHCPKKQQNSFHPPDFRQSSTSSEQEFITLPSPFLSYSHVVLPLLRLLERHLRLQSNILSEAMLLLARPVYLPYQLEQQLRECQGLHSTHRLNSENALGRTGGRSLVRKGSESGE